MKLRLPPSMIIALAIGIAIAAWVLIAVDFSEVMGGIARVGTGGLALLCLSLLGVLALLGAALLTATPGEPAGRLPLFLWSRMVREAASDLLPFSQIGGLVIGARVLVSGGIAQTRVY